MTDLEIIDVHTHTFASAERGIGWLRSIGHQNPSRNGTIDELLATMKAAGISRANMLMYTPTRFMFEARVRQEPLPMDAARRREREGEIKALMVQRMIQNNDWACEAITRHPELSFFAGLDPVYMDEATLRREIDDKVARGAKGVKIVLLALAIYANDRRLWPVYDAISRMGIPMLSQAGGDPQNGADAWGRPKYFAEALSEFPNLTVILAHLGHGYEEDVIDLCARFPNLYADVSSRLHDLGEPGQFTPQSLADFIRRCGPDHIMFGTNYPINDPLLYARVMRELPLSDAERRMVAAENAKRVLGPT